MIALLLIDLQNDFLPGGALAVVEGDQVVPVANRLMPAYPLVVATQDWHPAGHRSFASQHAGKSIGDVIKLDGLPQMLWPDHCIQGMWGAQFAPGLNVGGIDHIVRKGTDPQIDSYSGFFDNARRKSTGLEEYLHHEGVEEVHIVGLATDYCVKFAALDAVGLGFKTKVILEGVRGVELNESDCAAAIATMAEAGIEILRKESDDHRILFDEAHLRRVFQLRSVRDRDRRSRLPD